MYYQFDQYLVDTENLKLTHEGEFISDDEKTIRLLGLLCDAYPDVATKQFLIEQLWLDQVVTDWSLSKLVSDVRHMLGGAGGSQNQIKTVRGRGFRFNTEVIKLQEKPSDSGSQIYPKKLTETKSDNKSIRKNWFLGLIGVLLATTIYFGFNYFEPKTEAMDSELPLRIAVLPIESDTDDPINEWIKYGIMSMATDQLSRFSSIQTIPSLTVISTIADIDEDLSLKTDYLDYFNTLCGKIGCNRIVAIRFGLDENQKTNLSYQIYSENKRSIITDFTEVDVIDAAGVLLDFLVRDLIPTQTQRFSLTETFTNDNKANRDYAIGVNEIFSGESASAISYLKLALEKKPNFFWAKARLAEANYRSGKLDIAATMIDMLKQQTDSAKQLYFLDHLYSNVLYSLGKLDDSLKLSISLQQNNFAVDDPFLMGNELMNIGSSYQATGDLVEAESFLQKAREQYQLANYGPGEGKVLFNLGNVFLTLSQNEKAVSYYQKALECFVQFKMLGYSVMAKHQIATTSIDLGRIKYAETELTRIIAEYREIGDLQGELTAEVDLIWVKVANEDYQSAARQADKAISRIKDTQFSYLKEHASKMAVLVHLRLSNLEKAEMFYESVAGTWQDKRPGFAFVPAHLKLAQGDIPGALAMAQQVKNDLGDEFLPQHSAVLEQFELASSKNEIIPIVY